MKRLTLLFVLGPAILFRGPADQCQELTVQTQSGKQVLTRTQLDALPAKSVLEKAGVTFGESMEGKTDDRSVCLSKPGMARRGP